MFERKLIINNKTGLHSRPASMLVHLCTKYESNIKLVTKEKEINPKSIISILAGGMVQGTEVMLQVEGKDEEEAGKAIVGLINSLIE